MQIVMLDERHYDEMMDTVVVPALKTCRTDGYMEPATHDWQNMPLYYIRDLGKLHYVLFDGDEFRKLGIAGASTQDHGTITISHGFTEFAPKYQELIWYFLLAGFSVCILEHRGHGYSARDVDDKSVVYIDDWRRYVADYAKFVTDVVRPFAAKHECSRISLFAHSMGGGIAAAMLERYPSIVERAVLSSPMIAPKTSFLPNWLACTLCGALCDLGHAKERVPGEKDFEGTVNRKKYPHSSIVRMEYAEAQRIADTHYQTSCAANEWVRQAVRLSHAVLRSKQCERIETPFLLFQAGDDQWVKNVAENLFVERVKDSGGSVEFERVPHSDHEIWGMPNDVYGPYLKRILGYLQSTEQVTVLV